MRVNSAVKINRVRGPRLPYRPYEAEIFENEYEYLSADGIAVLDGEGILYWVDAVVTTDAGGVTVYDNNAASGKKIAGAYGAKADDSVIRSWNPPKYYKHGLYVDLTNSEVEICYKPIARNLRCTIDIAYAPGTSNLVCRVSTYYTALTKNLVSRVVIRRESSTGLVSQVTVTIAAGSANLVSRVGVLNEGSSALVCRMSQPLIKGESAALTCRLYADRTP